MTTNTAVTASITHLLSIMTNDRETTRQRIGAAKSLLAYEAPTEVVEKTKKFLTAVLENRAKYRTDTRLEAAELLRKAEARKVAQKSVGAEVSPQWRETMRRLKVAKRRLRLMDAGLWPAPSNWCDDLLSPSRRTVDSPAAISESLRGIVDRHYPLKILYIQRGVTSKFGPGRFWGYGGKAIDL